MNSTCFSFVLERIQNTWMDFKIISDPFYDDMLTSYKVLLISRV